MNTDYRAPAARRTVQILNLLAERTEPTRLSDLARELGCAKSSLLGILRCLEEERWLERDPAGGGYGLGEGFLATAEKAVEPGELREIVRPSLARLAATLGVSAFLGSLRADRIVVDACAEPDRDLYVTGRPGMAVPLALGAPGKVFLATGEPSGGRGRGGRLHRLGTPRPVEALELEQVRARGYALDDEETCRGVRTVAAPILRRGETVGVVWVSGFAETLDDAHLADAAERLLAETRRCSRSLEAREPGSRAAAPSPPIPAPAVGVHRRGRPTRAVG